MNDIIEQQIVSKAKARIGFRIHFLVFAVLTPINWIIWYAIDTSYIWPIWPTLGWGLGLLLHWLGVFHLDKFFSVKKEYAKLKEKNDIEK